MKRLLSSAIVRPYRSYRPIATAVYALAGNWIARNWITRCVGVCIVGMLGCGENAMGSEEHSSAPEYATAIQPLLTKYCAGCHNDEEAEADVQLHRYEALKASASSKKFLDGSDPKETKLWQLIAGTKEPVMPPVDEAQPTSQEKAMLLRWIEEGALAEAKQPTLRERLAMLNRTGTLKASNAIYSVLPMGSEQLLIGLQDRFAWQEGQWRSNLSLPFVGKPSQMRLSRDGTHIAIAGGVAGVGGYALVVQRTERGLTVVRAFEAHSDLLYAAVLHPNNRLLATAGYDRVLRLWNVETGELVRELKGHNGAVYDIDFDPSGEVLASASADETVKVWNVATGVRLDTYGQCEAEQYAVRFHPSGNQIVAAGADRRIRVWSLPSKSTPTVSPMLHSVFAHESPVVSCNISPDGNWIATAGEDCTLKLWSWPAIEPKGEIGKTSDTPTSLQWITPSRVVAATLSGELQHFSIQKSLLPPPSSNEPTDAPKPSASSSSSSIDPKEATRLQSKDLGEEVPLIPQTEGSPARYAASTTAELATENPTMNSARSDLPQLMQIPGQLAGKLLSEEMEREQAGDWYLLEAKQGETWVITLEGGKESPIDGYLDVLYEDRTPILRTRLQAVRESYFTFRGKDSTIADDFRMHRWEDMELNEYLYSAGEVVRLWLYPRGPDSGFKVYPGEGNRHTYFDTTATTHALNEPAWIVRELGESEEPTPNGLPVFPIFYANDDDATRRLNQGSRVCFQAARSGRYLVRVRDARGQAGDAFTYQLTVRRPRPDYEVRIEPAAVTLRPRGGVEFSVVATRLDGMEQAIRLSPEGLPKGVHLTHDLHIEPGQIRCTGTLYFEGEEFDALPKEFAIQLNPQGENGAGEWRKREPLKLNVKLDSKNSMPLRLVARESGPGAPPIRTFSVKAGTTGVLLLVIERGELQGDIAFGNEGAGRNLPHGAMVDNIGLNGLLIPAGESSREVFITVAPWVPPQTRSFHIKANVDGNPTTLPVQLTIVHE